MKKITLILLFSINCFGQNSYSDAQLLSEKGRVAILKRIQNISTTGVFQNYPKKDEIENFKNFLDTPFSESLTTINVKQSFGYIADVEALIGVEKRLTGKNNSKKSTLFEDLDGDDVANSIDKCPDIIGTVINDGCPDKLVAAEALKGQNITTILVDALAKFLVDHVKKEITITFYDNFRTQLDKTIIIPIIIKEKKIVEVEETIDDKDGKKVIVKKKTVTIEEKKINVEVKMRLLFPETFLLLESTGYFDTPSLGKTWVTAFKKDLVNLPSKFEIVIRDNKDLANTEIGKFALMSYESINRIKRGEHPMLIIKSMNNLYNGNDKKYENESQRVLGMLELISSNMTSKHVEGEQVINRWVTSEELDLLDHSSKTYLTALIYQQGVQSKLFDVIKIGDSNLKKKITAANFMEFYQYIQEMSSSFRTVTEMLAKVKEAAATPQTEKKLEDYAFYLSVFYDLFDKTMQSMYTLNGSEDYYDSFYATDVKPIVEIVIDMNNALAQKNYAQCILLSAGIMDNIIYKHLDDKAPNGNKDMLKNFMFYGNFLSDIIAASESKDSDNVKKIIEIYAMPVGSYRIKRSYSYSWDVSAFPGLYAGYEFTSDKENKESNNSSFSYGITAPVGISFSSKNNRKEQRSSSSTFFLSVIDIGAPFSYRFSNDQAQGLPEEIKWEQIFSPGFFYIFGFNNTPLSLSAGVQFTPLLRDIEDENNVLQEKNVIRLSLGLMVDIPIFNLKKGTQDVSK